jgi:hypothetical protein
MKLTTGFVIGVGVALALSAPAVNAQVPATTPGAAPAKPAVPPKPAQLPDGKPNWTGFWVPVGGLMEVYRGPSGVDGAPGAATANTPQPSRDLPPLKSPYKEQYEARIEASKKGPLPDPIALCYPQGMPRMMSVIYGMELLQTPNVIAITGEWNAQNRRIWMDLKEHPPEDELEETYMGHSIGRWEGDTLVVDTVGIRQDIPIDRLGLLHSSRLRVIERFTQTSPGILTIEQTIEDPEVFDGQWKSVRSLRYRPDLRLREFVCLENNRNVDEKGLPTFK